MRLPNPDRAVVDVAKLRGYCLSLTHNEGKFKARVFLAALGITSSDAPLVAHWLMEAIAGADAVEGKRDQFGTRYALDFSASHAGRSARIRSAWIVRTDEDFPRFVTCYVI